MNTSIMQAVALLVLTTTGTAADAALLKLEYSSSNIIKSGPWSAAGPLAQTVGFTAIIDTTSDTSSSLASLWNGLDPYRPLNSGVDVPSWSLFIDGIEKGHGSGFGYFEVELRNNDPAAGCHCGLAIEGFTVGGTLAHNFASIYDYDLPLASEIGDDPLAAILLAQSPITINNRVYMNGPWGFVDASDGVLTFTIVPLPSAAWLLGTGCVGFIGWTQRKRTTV